MTAQGRNVVVSCWLLNPKPTGTTCFEEHVITVEINVPSSTSKKLIKYSTVLYKSVPRKPSPRPAL